MRLRHIICAALLLSSAAAAADQVSVYSSETCGTWVEYRKAGGANSSIREAWVLGFISGYAMASPKALAQTDGGAMYVYLDKYCAERPLELIATAAEKLALELLKKKK